MAGERNLVDESHLAEWLLELEWHEGIDSSTLDLIHKDAMSRQDTLSAWADSIDAKIVGVFGIGSALVTVVPAIGNVDASGLRWIAWIVAIGSWIAALLLCTFAFGTRPFRVSPEAPVVLDPGWTSLSPDQYKFYRTREMALDWLHNKSVVNEKARALGWAIPLVAVESASLGVALLA